MPGPFRKVGCYGGGVAEELPERCAHPIVEGFPTDDLGSCHLPKGHDGMHTPLPVLWQMAGFMDGPWHPESRVSQKIRDWTVANPEAYEQLLARRPLSVPER